MKKIRFRRISTGSLYKIIFVGSWVGSLPIFTILGVFALFGFDTVSWNDKQVTGLKALILSPLIGLFIATFFAAFVGSLVALGLWIFSKFESLSLFCEMESGVDEDAIDT